MNRVISARAVNLLLLVCLLSACATAPTMTEESVDASTIKLIQLQVKSIDRQALEVATGEEALMEQVKKNLVGWGYPIEVSAEKSYSHVLIARVEPVEKGASTPSGFSFTPGNSNPRAKDFQKADVLPVSCELMSLAHPEQKMLLSMHFTINALPWVEQKGKYVISPESLEDHVSTVCFNLLNDLEWPEKLHDPAIPAIAPSWIPEIRIETIKDTAPLETIKEHKAPESDNAVQNLEAPESEQSEKQAEKADSKPAEKPSGKREGRKQIIIHNQGSPVIIKFGYDRK